MVKFVLLMVVLNLLLCYPPGTEGWERVWGRDESPRSRIMGVLVTILCHVLLDLFYNVSQVIPFIYPSITIYPFIQPSVRPSLTPFSQFIYTSTDQPSTHQLDQPASYPTQWNKNAAFSQLVVFSKVKKVLLPRVFPMP